MAKVPCNPIALRESGLVAVDGLLTPGDFERLRIELRHAEFRDVHSRGWDRVWRLTDGNPLRGPSVVYDPTGRCEQAGRRYPTGSVVDRVIDEIRGYARRYADIAGVEGRDWDALYLAPWLYPPGSALSTHWDAGRYTGSFTFFAHPSWSLHWGGELIVPRDGPELARARADGLDRETLDAVRWELGPEPGELDAFSVSSAITPRPNRLVLLAGSRPHRVARVDATAGAHIRTSLAGFFLRRS